MLMHMIISCCYQICELFLNFSELTPSIKLHSPGCLLALFHLLFIGSLVLSENCLAVWQKLCSQIKCTTSSLYSLVSFFLVFVGQWAPF